MELPQLELAHLQAAKPADVENTNRFSENGCFSSEIYLATKSAY